MGDRDIGGKIGDTSSSNEKKHLLCMKGGSEGPKTFKRFSKVDEPVRQLCYMSDEEAFDAIQYIPKKDI